MIIICSYSPDCSLESRQRSLHILSSDAIDLGSKAGPANIQAFAAITIQAGNQINLHSRKISLQGLKSAAAAASQSVSDPADDSTADADATRDQNAAALQVRHNFLLQCITAYLIC
jgi:hypothetical protein